MYAWLVNEARKTKSCLVSFPACEATTANMAAAETAAKIYHGTRVLLDRIPVNEETA